MSKLNLVILTLCVTGVVIFLLVFPLYVSFSLILPAVLFFFYIDYKNQQSTLLEREHRPRPSHAGGLPSYKHIQELIGSFWGKISLSMQTYYVGLVNQSSGNADLSVPSHSRSAFSSNSRKLNASGNSVRTIANLDENRPSSSFYRPNGNYSFDVGLSPIRLTDGSPASDFRNLRISDRPRSMDSSLHMRTRNQSLTPMKSSLGDPCSSRKHQNVRGSPKNIQSIAGPLLASTRYNLSLDPVAYADVTSAGLASRLVKYATDHPATHQQQYSGPGQFPTVQLGKTSRLPMVTRSQAVGRSPVRIRIAPPEFSERRNYISPGPTHLHTSSSLDRLKEISRPDRLQDGPRKRLHAQLGEAEDEAAKKQRVGAEEAAATSKRGREEESPKDDVKTKRTKNNEIFSSLSSSRHLTTGTNKRKQSLDDWSQSGTPMPAGKQAKKSMPSPETLSNSTDQVKTPLPSQHMEMEATPLTSKTLAPQVDQSPVISTAGPTPRPTERSALTKVATAPMKGLLYRPSRDVSGWVTAETFPDSESTAKEKAKLAGEDLKNQRELDAKRRLSSMMFIVGDKEQTAQKDLSSTSSLLSTAQPVSSTPTFSISKPTPTLSTAKSTPSTFQETSTPKSSDKHVHFADNLTQIKTFSADSTDSSSSSTQSVFGSNKSLDQPSSSQMSEVKTNTLNKTQDSTGGSVSIAFGTPKVQSAISNTTTKMGENMTLKFGSESPNVMLNFGTTEEKKKSEGDSLGSSQQAVNPSVGFSFGSNASSSSSTLSSFPIVKSSPVANTLTSTAVPSGQDTSSVAVFGKSSLSSSQQLGQPSTTFSQSAPISSTTFGETMNSPVMFGVKSADSSNSLANISTPTTTSNAPLSFGQSVSSLASSQSNTVLTASSKPSFGSVSPATFGGSTQISSGFSALGSKEKATAAPSFVTSVTSSGFSTPATVSAGSGFGSPATLSTSGTFGTPTAISSSSGFGTPSTVSASGGFGSPATVSAGVGFGTPSTVSASGGFGSPATVSAGGGFGTPSTVSASGGFGTPASLSASGGFGTPATVSSGGGFGTPVTLSASGGFGSPATVSASGGFGTTASSNTLFGFGAATTAQSQSAGFGSQTNPVQTGFGGFGTSTTQTATAFGGKPAAQGGFSFGGNSATTVSSANNSSMFGAKSDKQVATPNFSLGNQNVASSVQTADMGGGQGFKIDFSQTSKQSGGSAMFGGISSASPMLAGNSFAAVSKQATTTAQNAFQFGGSSAKPFSFGASASNENAAPNTQFNSASSNAAPPNTTQNTPNVFGQSVFGSQSQQQPISTTINMSQQKPGGLFNFGGGNVAAQQTANSFVFGGNSGTTQSGGFAFGTAAPQAPQVKPTGGFAFGASSAPQTTQSNPFGQASQPQLTAASQAFQFGSAASTPSGGFNFGSGASNTPAPAFGAGSSNNAFQMGSAPQPQAQGQGMFSIGTGSAAPRARTARLMRRQR